MQSCNILPVTANNTASTRMGRRKYLTLAGIAAAGLAGCSGGSGETTPSATATPEATPESFARTFYTTLFGEDDIKGANALYHDESQAPELTSATFEQFGGLESMQAEIETIEVVSQGEGTAFVHIDVTYTIPAGSATDTDYLYLRESDEGWRMNVWFPETPRENAARQTVTAFYQTLYGEDDIEGANTMYHPESSGGDLSASDFEPYGGLENIEASVESTELVSEGDGTAEVHAEVAYTTPEGSSTNTDHVFLRLQGPAWKIDSWAPETSRN